MSVVDDISTATSHLIISHLPRKGVVVVVVDHPIGVRVHILRTHEEPILNFEYLDHDIFELVSEYPYIISQWL